jgi:hypothetical protein
MMTDSTPVCIYCQRSSEQIPLIQLLYKGKEHWICPQHLPILIHKPGQLSEKLPGMDLVDLAAVHEH